MKIIGNLKTSSLRSSGAIVLLASLLACVWLATGCSSGEAETGPDQQLVGELIRHYFSSWSKPDLPAYAGCFHPQASIYFIDPSGKPHFFPLDKFIAEQKKAHLTATEPLIERPTHSTIEVRGRLAHATVRWELNINKTSQTGTDFFTLVKTGQGWKILTLVFEQDKK